MIILEQLRRNKGTISSQLSKDLAKDVLNGNTEILQEAIDLCCFLPANKKEKNVRSGAAKIIEIVAEVKPELVAPHLEKLLPGLGVDEPQTRWMTIRTMGFCARFRPDIAKQAIPYARQYIREKKDGQLCLVSSADLFLGDYGELSTEAAHDVFPILLESTDNVIVNEPDWLFEAFIKIAGYLEETEKLKVLSFAEAYENLYRKSTQARIRKLKQLCE